MLVPLYLSVHLVKKTQSFVIEQFKLIRLLNTRFSAPCELPAITHGQYLLGYRAGLTIANGSFVTFQCDPEFIKTTLVSIECVLGRLVPKVPSCKRGLSLYLPKKKKCVKISYTKIVYRRRTIRHWRRYSEKKRIRHH